MLRRLILFVVFLVFLLNLSGCGQRGEIPTYKTEPYGGRLPRAPGVPK
jgi:uncharacterized lipoprotein YehR (DUF1307 family)